MASLKRLFLLFTAFSIISGLFSGCNSGGVGVNNGRLIQKDQENYYLVNDKVRFYIDKETGYVKKVQNLITKTNYKKEEVGSWPFEIEYGDNRDIVKISADTVNKVKKFEVKNSGNAAILEVYYENLKMQSDEETGINAVVKYVIEPEWEYAKFSVSFDMKNAKGSIQEIRLAMGGLVSGNTAQNLLAPVWGGGNFWRNPTDNKYFKDGVSLGYPGKDATSLEMGWMDLYTKGKGIGVAYINKQELAMEFKISTDGTTMSYYPELLYPEGIIGKHLVLEPGNSFTTDEVVIAPHAGDWHTMADIYRTEYQKAFVTEEGKPDYLNWDTLSKKVKDADFIVRYFAGLDGETIMTFDQMYEQTVSKLKDWYQTEEPKGDRCMVWIAGQNEKGYAFDVPNMIPAHEPSGGTEGLKRLDDNLHKIGATVFHYEHPFAVDPESSAYFKETDPMQHTEFWNLCMHHSVCIDNKTMQDYWKNNIIPSISSVNADGIQFDQAPLQQTVCDLPGHHHELDSLARLSSHAQGVNTLSKMVRENLSDEAYIVSEAYNDILCRNIDVAQTCWHMDPLWEGEHAFYVRKYTFPYIVSQYNSGYKMPDGAFINCMLTGAIIGDVVCLSDGAPVEIPREYIRFREDIRKANAPGFPYGFKDVTGITTNNGRLIAKAFVGKEGVTVTYLSNGMAVKGGKIMVDLDKLGMKGAGVKEIAVDLEANKCGYQIFKI